MGLREKVTITLVIIALIQIACRHCMPRTPRKASLKRYLNDLKPVKNNPTPTPYSPSRLNKAQKQTFGKTAQNGKICQNSLPKKSLYQTYKFPEMEFPLDNSPRDPFHTGLNFNDNNHVSTLQKARNLQSIAINDLKKEMKMKRKLLSNKQNMNSEISPLKTDMASIKITSNPAPMRLLDSESFPEVQYPLNTMDTWGQNYRSFLPFTQEKQFNGFGQQTLNHQAKEDINKPFTRLTKAKANRYLQSYDKLKEEHRRTSTQNSKRSNAGQKGLNFTKTATCEKTSDDFMTAGLISNIQSNSTETKRTLEALSEIKPTSENTCPVTEYPKHSMPIPYRCIDNNTEIKCAFKQEKNIELHDVDTSVIAQTLQLIEEILLHDDTSSAIPTDNYNQNIENNVDSSNSTDVPAKENIPNTLMDTAKNYPDSPAEEISQEVPDDAASGILQDEMPSVPEEILVDNATATEGPLSVRMPFPFSGPIEFEAVKNGSERGPINTAPIANSNTVPGSTSIIIIPLSNNSDGKSLSHILESTTGTPIIVYLPSTQNSGIPSQTQNQIVSSLLENFVPNNEQSNVLSNMAPLQNDNPSSTALISELLNSISDSGSSLPMHETLPNNSMCDINENSPSSMKEKPISDILIDKLLTDDVLLTTINCDEKLSEQPTETYNRDSLPPTPDFEHPLFDFAGSEFSSLSHGPYNNVLINELPILPREINSDEQYSNVSSEHLCIPTLNVTSEHLHKNISDDASPEIASDITTIVLDPNYSNSDSQQQPIMIDEIPPSPLFDATIEEQLPKRTPLLLNPLSETISDHLSEIADMNIPPTPSPTTDNTSSLPDPLFDKSPITTDMSIKSELYNIRQILEKMLSSQIPNGSQTKPTNAIMPPSSETDSLPIIVNEALEPNQTLTDSVSVPVLEETDTTIDRLPLQEHEKLPYIPADGSSLDTLPLPVDQSRIRSLLLDTTNKTQLLIDERVLPQPVIENPADNKPYLLDNLVTPLSETRTRDTLINDLSHTIDEMPSKIDFVIPSIHEIPSDEPLSVVNLPVIKTNHQEDVTNPKSEVLQNNLPMQVFEPQSSLSNLPIRGLSYPDKTLPTQKVSEAVLPNVSSEFYKTTMSSYLYEDKMQHDFTPSIVHSYGDETVQKVALPLSVIPAHFLSDAPTIAPFLPDNSQSPINAKVGEFTHARTDTKDLPLVKDPLFSLSSEDYTTPDSLITHILKAGPLSTNSGKATDVVLSEPILSKLPHHDILSTEDKMLPSTENIPTDLPLTINKIPSSSKLSIAMALLENVLFEISKEGLSSPETKPIPVTPSLNFDKTEYQVDVVSSPSETEDIYPKPEALPNPGNIISLPPDKEPSITPNFGIPCKELSFKIEETPTGKPLTSVDIQTVDIETQTRTETLPLDNPDVLLCSDNLSLPLNTLDRTIPSNKNTVSASKLPITKALLENVLSDVTTSGFSLPAASKAVPLKSSVLEKTEYYAESPLSAINEQRPATANEIVCSTTVPPRLFHESNDLNFTHAGKSEENLTLEVDQSLSEISSLDISSEVPLLGTSSVDISSPTSEIIPTETPSDLLNVNTIPSSKLPITKALLQNILSDVTSKSFSLPISKVLPVKSSLALDKTLYYAESLLSDITDESPSEKASVNEMIPNKTYSDQPTEDNRYFSEQTKDTMPLEVEKSLLEFSNLDILSERSSPMDKTNNDMSSRKVEILPEEISNNQPLSNTKTLASSKLPITKALLENILSDVTSKSFSLPISKVLAVKSSLALDKTLYYAESLLSDITDESPSEKASGNEMIPNKTYSDQPTKDNRSFSEQIKDTMPLEVEKSLLEFSNLDILSERSSPMDKTNNDMSSRKVEILPEEISNNQPLSNTKTLASSKLPITKALLENVLYDVTSNSFSLPVSKVLPVKSSSVLNTTHYLETPLSDLTEESPSSSEIPSVKGNLSSTPLSDQPIDINLPFSGQPADTLSSELEKTFSKVSNLDIPSEISSSLTDKILPKTDVDITLPNLEIISEDTISELPIPNNKTLSSSKLPITKAPLENGLTDVTTKDFSLSVSKVPHEKSSLVLNKTEYFESPLSDFTEEDLIPIVNNSNTLSEVTREYFMDGILSKSNVDNTSAKVEVLPKEIPSELPSSNTKTLSSSKLSITKALLQNVLSDINTKGFSVPVAKSNPVETRTRLDKTLYYMDFPHSDSNEECSGDDFRFPDINEDDFELSLEKIFTDNPNLDMPVYDLPIDQISKDESDDLTEETEGEDSNETLSDNPMDDTYDLPTQMDKPLSLSDNMSNDLPMPQNNRLFASRIPITRALLEKVLSDINDGSIRP